MYPNKEVFDKAVSSFIKKWLQKKQTELVEYMKLHWLFTTHQNWYEGIAHYIPSTNNALEFLNLVIKKEDTFCERLPLRGFLELIIKTVENGQKNILVKVEYS